jgi:hypothetical protein
VVEEAGVPRENHDHGQATGKLYNFAAASRVHPFCNLQSRARTHAVLVIGLYELLGNPTTYLTETPGSLRDMKYIVVGTLCLSNSLFTVWQCAQVVLITSIHSGRGGIIGRLTVIYIIMQCKRNRSY